MDFDMKKTLLHVIYNLGRGGAETMLVQVIKKLPEYYNIVVTLQEDNHFEDELECDEYICLNQPSIFSIPLAALRLRKLVKARNIDIVHSHLPLSNFVARLAVPFSIPLINTIHNSILTSLDYKKWFIRFLDKSTYNFRKSIIIAVSKNALDDYFSVLSLKKGEALVLYNFVDTELFKKKTLAPETDAFRAICVASLSRQKNIAYLVNGFSLLDNSNINLHIYGSGELQKEVQNLIDVRSVDIVLKGQVTNIAATLPKYDIFVMASLFEGFSLSVLEAMAAGIPVLLSDIPSFREQCGEHAIYFDLNDPNDFAAKIKILRSDRTLCMNMANNARNYVLENFALEHYMKELKRIYNRYLPKKIPNF